jgi:hypothetical protein
MHSFTLSTTWAGVRANGEAMLRCLQVQNSHFVLMELLNPGVCLKAMYPFTGDRAILYDSIMKLIALFF